MTRRRGPSTAVAAARGVVLLLGVGIGVGIVAWVIAVTLDLTVVG